METYFLQAFKSPNAFKRGNGVTVNLSWFISVPSSAFQSDLFPDIDLLPPANNNLT